MTVRRLLLTLSPLFILCLCAQPVSAETVIEALRLYMFGEPACVAVNATDGSCWVAEEWGGTSVVHLAEDGSELWRGGLFYNPRAVAVDPTDGSCWVADTGHGQLVRLTSDGTEIVRESWGGVLGLSLNPADGSCWITGGGVAILLASDGSLLTEQWETCCAESIAVNESDGSCWVAGRLGPQVIHLAADGTVLWRGGEFYQPDCVSVNPTDDSCWVADNTDVVHLAENGDEIWRRNLSGVYSVAVNPTDGSCWVGTGGKVFHFAADGTELWQGAGFDEASSLSVNRNDGSCWVADYWNGQVVHLLPSYHTLTFTGSGSVKVNGALHSLPWSGVLHEGCVVTLEAVPDSCYDFTTWSGDHTSTDNPTTVTMDGDKTITVGSSPVSSQFTLNLAGSGNGSVTVDGEVAVLPWSGSFDCGTQISLEAVPDSGWTFIAWSGDLSEDENPTTIVLDRDTSITAEFTDSAHTFSVAAECDPFVTMWYGSECTATANDSYGHSVSSWEWDDGGAGGWFLPSADVQNPAYYDLGNGTDQSIEIALTVTATCGGPSPVSASDSVTLVVEPRAHGFEVKAQRRSPLTAGPVPPSIIPSGGSHDLWANFDDHRVGHSVSSWAWDDGGAGGSFVPSPTIQNPVYIAPLNVSGSDLAVMLTVSATCDGPSPATDSDSITLIVRSEGAEVFVEGWRSEFGYAHAVSAVDPSDGSCWAATGGSVMHVAADGTVLSQTDGFSYPGSIAVYLTDKSCWVADRAAGEVVHLAADGTQLWCSGAFAQPWSVCVNPDDGSCWVADRGIYSMGYDLGQIVHLAPDGSELWRGGGFDAPSSISVDPTDGSVWVVDVRYGSGSVVHVAEDGTEVFRFWDVRNPQCVAVDPSDSSCWIADTGHGQVVHLAADGSELLRAGMFAQPEFVAVDPSDHSCWVAADGFGYSFEGYGVALIHLSQDGTELLRTTDAWVPKALSVDPGDHSWWLTAEVAYGYRQLLHMDAGGTELWRGAGFSPALLSVSANPGDNSCWVADMDNNEVVHLAESGVELLRQGGYSQPVSVSVNSNDNSCWIAEQGVLDYDLWQYVDARVTHLAENGAEIWSGWDSDATAKCVSVDTDDDSCWVAAPGGTGVIHYDEYGGLLWTGNAGSLGHTYPGAPNSVSADPSNGSCWVANWVQDSVALLAEDGTELWSAPAQSFDDPVSVSADPNDHSCWVADRWDGAVVHVSESGTELGRATNFMGPDCTSVDPADSSCWVADSEFSHPEISAWDSSVVRLAADGTQLWRGSWFGGPTAVSANTSDGSCWVADTVHNQIAHLVPGYILALNGDSGWVRANGHVHRLPWSGAFPGEATVTLEVISDSCQDFVGWSGDLTGSTNPDTITMDADKSVTANFTIIQYTLSLTGSGNGSIEVDGTPVALPWSDLFDCGTTVSLQAVPDSGWLFSHWSGDLTSSTSPDDITMDGEKNIATNFILHTFEVTPNAPVPNTVGSGGSADLSATFSDSGGHSVASWSWDDGGAGGSFSPSPTEQNPTYNAPANTTDSNLVVTLTVNATCDGAEPLGDSDWTSLAVEPVAHTFEVTANAPVPDTVGPGGTADLSAVFSDSGGHSVASWSWDDGAAGGSFDPSPDEQNPSYTAPMNLTGADLVINLTLEATCDGTPPLLDTDSTTLTVLPIPIPEVLLEVHPNERAPGAIDPQFLGWDPWTQPTSSPANSYWWKKYEFYANGPVWIQVCAQNWDKWQKGYASDDNTWLDVNGIKLADYDGIQSGPPGGWQWVGSKENGQRWALRFLHLGTPGKQDLWIGADESPLLWWIKVTDLEPGFIEAIE